MKKMWLFCLLFLFAGIARSEAPPEGVIVNGEGTVILNWTPPSTYADGQPFRSGDPTGYAVYWGQSRFMPDGTTLRPDCAAKPQDTVDDVSCYASVLIVDDGTIASTSLVLSVDGDQTVYFAVVARTGSGDWSVYSNEAAKVFSVDIEASPPNAPTSVTVEFTQTVTCTTSDPSVTCTITISDPVIQE